MGKQKKNNGQSYTDNTVNQYASSLKNATTKLGKIDIKSTDSFNYDTFEEFMKIQNMIKEHPKFKEYNMDRACEKNNKLIQSSI